MPSRTSVACNAVKKLAMKTTKDTSANEAARRTIPKAKNCQQDSKRASCKRISRLSCLAILKQLQALDVTPKGEAQTLLRQTVMAAKTKRQEEACTLLGRVLARVAVALEADVCKAQELAEKASEGHRRSIRAQSQAELALKDAKKAMLESKAEVKESAKAISTETKAIAAADKEKKVAAIKVHIADEQKRVLKHVQESTFRPLKEASLQGAAAKKQIQYLCTAGLKIGFDDELLKVAPAVLGKELERRQTFDRYVVQSLDIEFAKRVGAVSSKQKQEKQAFEEHDQALEEMHEALSNAKMRKEQGLTKLVQAETALKASKLDAADAKKRMTVLKSALKKSAKSLAEARSKHSNFRLGPLGAYIKLLGDRA